MTLTHPLSLNFHAWTIVTLYDLSNGFVVCYEPEHNTINLLPV